MLVEAAALPDQGVDVGDRDQDLDRSVGEGLRRRSIGRGRASRHCRSRHHSRPRRSRGALFIRRRGAVDFPEFDERRSGKSPEARPRSSMTR